MAFLTQNKGKLCKILIITLVFEKNANFFDENCRKSQKIVIITSTPGGGDHHREARVAPDHSQGRPDHLGLEHDQ
jgi:hypothetical protein